MAEEQEQKTEDLSDEQLLMKLASAMKDSSTLQDEKHNVHTFLDNVVKADDTTKIGNLNVDKDIDELGLPIYPVRDALDLALISEKIMNNKYYQDYFEKEAENTLATSLSRSGFLIRQATTVTKVVADATKRRKSNKGWFGKKTTESSGGDPNIQDRD